jgi:hypothetical protein
MMELLIQSFTDMMNIIAIHIETISDITAVELQSFYEYVSICKTDQGQ